MSLVVKFLFVAVVIILFPFWLFTILAFGNLSSISQAPSSVIILGAGVQNGQPSKILQLRLDEAVKIYKTKKIDTILVSGDNRDVYYNEPKVMKNYLEDQGIPSGIIQIDVLGIRTLDSCQRASSIFNIKKAYLVSQAYHLARASFLCRQEGVEVVPVSAQDSCAPIYCSQIIREVAASWLAVFNISGVSEL
jgi:vancomycin permeability regulator SanA